METLFEEREKILNQFQRIKRKYDEILNRKAEIYAELVLLKHQYSEVDRALALVDGRYKVITVKVPKAEKKSQPHDIRKLFREMTENEKLELRNALLDLDEKIID
jgi:hypothetical protein